MYVCGCVCVGKGANKAHYLHCQFILLVVVRSQHLVGGKRSDLDEFKDVFRVT